MFYYTLYLDKISKTGVKSIEEALRNFKKYTPFVDEVKELTAYLLSNIDIKTFPIGEDLPQALEQYGCYTREEIFTIFGRQTAEKRMQGSVSGVFNIEECNTELLFVTLNKSDKEHKVYGYEDYKIDLNSVVDEDVDIEKIIETKMRIKDLYQALRKLNDEELKVIDSLYFKKMTIRDLAKEQQVSSKKIFSFRNKILKKLREMLK